jgi:hypothetical protein
MANELTPTSWKTQELGPKMKALPNDRMRQFVWELLIAGDNNHAAAATRAGYISENPHYMKVQAHRLCHRQDVLAAIQEVAEKFNRSSVAMAVRVREQIASSPIAKDSDRLKAVDSILSSAGMGPKSVHEVNVTITDAQMIRELTEMAKVLGVDPKTLVGDKAKTIDATDYHEVYPGLEDLV